MSRNEKFKSLIETTKGRIFCVTFIKADGTIRKMVCRTSVKKGVNGNGHAMNEEKQAIRRRVFDMQKQAFRTIPIDRIIEIKFQGQIYTFNWQDSMMMVNVETCPNCYEFSLKNNGYGSKECTACGHYEIETFFGYKKVNRFSEFA